MDQVLYIQATNAKCNDIKDLRAWVAEVKRLDVEKRFKRLQAIKAFELSAAASRAASRTGNNSGQSNMLSGPSYKAAMAAPYAASSAAGTLSKPNSPPKMAEEEKTLLRKNDGCL